MSKLQFRQHIPINIPHTLRQLLAPFQGVKDGLPELIKNSKDQYSRLQINDPDTRTIVVAIDTKEKSIAVIDFGGAGAAQFKGWETWSDPEANTKERAADIEGGHGNGGKAFMVMGSTTDSFFESCFDSRRTRMGYDNESDSTRYKPGIAVENGIPAENLKIDSARKCLDRVLADLHLKFDHLPRQAQQAFIKRQAYTIAQVNGVKDWSKMRDDTLKRSALDVKHAIETHPQAASTLDSCSVWFLVDGKTQDGGPAKISYPEPFEGFADPERIPIPSELNDPDTKEKISTGRGTADTRVLVLRTSWKSLRTEDMRPLHVIRVHNERNTVAIWSVADLCPGASSGFIFGEIRVPALEGEHLAGADRKSLADTPLVRALQNWTSEQIKSLADRIQQATAREHKEQDRDKVNESLDKLRDLMRKFLTERDSGDAGSGAGNIGDSGGRKRKSGKKGPGNVIHVIKCEDEVASVCVALGTTVPVKVAAFERDAEGKLLHIANPDLVMMATPDGIVECVDGPSIRARAAGEALLWFETRNGDVKSNLVVVEVANCSGVSIDGLPDRALKQGERIATKLVYSSGDKNREDLLNEASVDEIGMGRVNRLGIFVAGMREGQATLRVRWGAKQVDTSSKVIRIGSERIEPRSDQGGDTGGEIPLIVLCGTTVPGMESYPPEQRTIPPSEHMPTIIDYEPAFENVIFINPDSIESIQARKGRGGRKGVASIATGTYYQFIALKCFEILKRLWVFEHAREAPLTEVQFRERFATAEIECAPFIEGAYQVAESLADGKAEPQP